MAGRETERREFARLLDQDVVLENVVLTGLRGVGKTVLLETFKPMAQRARWLWIGADLSESATVSETALATRVLADLAVATSSFTMEVTREPFLFNQPVSESRPLDFQNLSACFASTPGLVSDKLKAVLELVGENLPTDCGGIVFAYDEAQNLADHAAKEEYPLSILLEVFQSLQKKGFRFMLALTGLPTLFPKLVEARTYAERMFRVIFLERLSEQESRDAITEPIGDAHCPVTFSGESIDLICEVSGGYPYFIQFICREVYDLFIQRLEAGQPASVPIDEIMRKLDSDFFAGRWARATDRQHELLWVIAQLPNSEAEFTVQEIVAESKARISKPFSGSHVNQMLVSLAEAGLVYKNRHGKYSFAVPLLGRFIKRQGDPTS
ncbi:MAG: AAA family ATPase [Phycisphaerales bacterium]|nr:AAA family ATPase [Phycisphaerales bacterium]